MRHNQQGSFSTVCMSYMIVPPYFTILGKALQMSLRNYESKQTQLERNKETINVKSEENDSFGGILIDNNQVVEPNEPKENINQKILIKKLQLNQNYIQNAAFNAKTTTKVPRREKEVPINEQQKIDQIQYNKIRKNKKHFQREFELERKNKRYQKGNNQERKVKPHKYKISFLGSAKIHFGLKKDDLFKRMESLMARKVQNWSGPRYQWIKSRELAYLFS